MLANIGYLADASIPLDLSRHLTTYTDTSRNNPLYRVQRLAPLDSLLFPKNLVRVFYRTYILDSIKTLPVEDAEEMGMI